MNTLFTIARKEFLHIRRDRKTLAFLVVMPLMLLIIYGYGINFDVRDIRIAIVDYDRTAASREFIDSMTASGYFVINQRLDDMHAVDRVIDLREARVGVIIPPGFQRDLARGTTSPIQFVIDGSDGNTAGIAYGYIAAMTNGYNLKLLRDRMAERGVDPALLPIVDVKSRFWFNQELKSSNFIVPGIIAIIMMMIGAVATTLTLVTEKENGTMEQLIVSPVKPWQIIFGKLAPYVVISFLALIVVICAAWLLFGLWIAGSLPLLLLLAVVYLICVLGLGIFVSSITSDMSSAMMLSMMITMLPSILLSGFVFPIRNMPEVLQALSYVVPARYFLRIIRGIYLKGIGIEFLWTEVIFLLLFALVVFGFSIRRFRKRLD